MKRFAVIAVCMLSMLTQPIMIRAEKHTFTSKVFFATDSFRLTPESQAELDKIFPAIQEAGHYEVWIDAHTDNTGNNTYNLALSERRAAHVLSYLTACGLNREQVYPAWHGAKIPLTQNNNEDGKQLNRRVDVTIILYKWKNVSELFSELKTEPESFNINLNKPTQIRCANGLLIALPAQSLVHEDGSKPDYSSINFQITEALKPADWLLNGLTTLSENGLLQSGGMFKIEATAKGKPLKPADGVNITAQVPFKRPIDGMQLFTATENMVWQQQPQPLNVKMLVNPPAHSFDTFLLAKIIERYKSRMAKHDYNVSVPVLSSPPKLRTHMPRKLNPPVRENIRLNESAIKLLFMSRREKEKRKDRLYEQRMAEYEKCMLRNEAAKQKHLAAVAKYEIDMLNYEREKEAFNKALQQSILSYNNLLEKFYEQLYIKNMIDELQKLQVKLRTDSITNPRFTDFFLMEVVNKTRENSSYLKFYPHELLLCAKKLNEVSKQEYTGAQILNFHTAINMGLIRYENDSLLRRFLVSAKQNLIAKRLNMGLDGINDMAGYYQASLTSFSWVNIDKLMNEPLNAKLEIKNSAEDAKVYVLLEKSNSIIEHRGSTISLPQAAKVTIFSIALIDGVPHYAIEKTTLSKNDNSVSMIYKKGLINDIVTQLTKAV